METAVFSLLFVQVCSDLEFLHQALFLDSASTSLCYCVPVTNCHKTNPLKTQCLGTIIWYYCLWFWVNWFLLGRLSCGHIQLSAKTEATEGLTGLDTQVVSPLPCMVFGLGLTRQMGSAGTLDLSAYMCCPQHGGLRILRPLTRPLSIPGKSCKLSFVQISEVM